MQLDESCMAVIDFSNLRWGEQSRVSNHLVQVTPITSIIHTVNSFKTGREDFEIWMFSLKASDFSKWAIATDSVFIGIFHEWKFYNFKNRIQYEPFIHQRSVLDYPKSMQTNFWKDLFQNKYFKSSSEQRISWELLPKWENHHRVIGEQLGRKVGCHSEFSKNTATLVLINPSRTRWIGPILRMENTWMVTKHSVENRGFVELRPAKFIVHKDMHTMLDCSSVYKPDIWPFELANQVKEFIGSIEVRLEKFRTRKAPWCVHRTVSH